MPTYDYRCSKGHQFELFQRISDKPVAKCPTCAAKATRVISGGAGLIFKGSGFYITDYGKDGKGPRKPESSSDGAPAPAEASKPAAAAPAAEPTPKAESSKKPKKGAS